MLAWSYSRNLPDSFKSGCSDLGIKHSISPSHRISYSDLMKYHYSNTATGIVRDSHPVPLPPFFGRHLLNLL